MFCGLLIITIVLLKVRCNVCCSGASFKCILFTDQTRCERVGVCEWDNNACRESICEDGKTVESCYGVACRWNNNACSTVRSCTGWSADECAERIMDGGTDNYFRCFPTDSGCKVAVCGDFTNESACNSTYYVETGCFWDNSGSGSCKAVTGCESWGVDVCSSHLWNGTNCIVNDDGKCVARSCSVYTTSERCISDSSCKWDTSCTNVTSCSDYDETRCDRQYVTGYNGKCIWSGTSCRVAECSDWDNDTSCIYSIGNYNLFCTYNDTDSKCTPLTPCSTYSNGNDCDAHPCHWLSRCTGDDAPVYNDSGDSNSAASLIYVSALSVALLLFLAL